MRERVTRRTAAARRAEGVRAGRTRGDQRSAPVRSAVDAVESLRAYLRAAGYRALPGRAWSPRVLGVFANDECDRVVLMRNRFGCLELRPLDVHPDARSGLRCRSRRQDPAEDEGPESSSQ